MLYGRKYALNLSRMSNISDINRAATSIWEEFRYINELMAINPVARRRERWAIVHIIILKLETYK